MMADPSYDVETPLSPPHGDYNAFSIMGISIIYISDNAHL
jgi:hypothetical protein